MFSGIIDAIGIVRATREAPWGRRLVIEAPGYWSGLREGASVAIDGVCLTVVGVEDAAAQFDVVGETLRCTTLGEQRSGDRVNLQRSLRAGDPIDGHFVQGHIDGTAVIRDVARVGNDATWTFALDSALLPYVIPKGSIAVDGISLTIAQTVPDGFSVALIPTTLERTTLGGKAPGQRVNIETDVLARTVVHGIQSIIRGAAEKTGGVDLESIRRFDIA